MSDISGTIDMDITEEEPMEIEEEEVKTEIIHTELDTQEIEIESDLVNDPEEILPDIVDPITPLPPLRPLTIAPKPAKMSLAFTSSGQQVFVVQGGSTGQSLKLVSSLPQGISLGNFQSGKTISLRTVPKVVPATNLSVLQPKQVVMKKIIPVSKASVPNESKAILLKDAPEQISSNRNNVIVSSPAAKTITLAQAQQLGILPSTKLISQVGTKQTVMINKSNLSTKQVKGVLQTKQPPKILPAPEPLEHFILKPSSASNSNMVSPGQIIQVSGSPQLIAGQLHQINIPGKGVQYIKIVTSSPNTPGTVSISAASTSTTNSKKVVLMPTTEAKLPLLTPVNNVSTSKLNNIVLAEAAANSTTIKTIKTNAIPRSGIVSTPDQLLLLPTPKVPIPQIKTVSTSKAISELTLVDMNLDSNGMRPRKPCNCNKSQCLKLYCDCFANGEFCYLCNCTNCSNNLDNEELRQRAIKSCLDRNPNAFRPKIGKAKDIGDAAIRKHTKGCNCKRSGCLKNYCECYEAKIACSNNCKCVGCRNVEDMMDKKMALAHNSHIASSPPLLSKMNHSTSAQIRQRHFSNKFAFNFITDEVIEATSQCLLTISENADHTQDEETLKREIIQEFGRCLMEIIECSSNRVVSTIN